MLDPIRVSWEARTHPMINNFPDPIRSFNEKNTQNDMEINERYPVRFTPETWRRAAGPNHPVRFDSWRDPEGPWGDPAGPLRDPIRLDGAEDPGGVRAADLLKFLISQSMEGELLQYPSARPKTAAFLYYIFHTC